MSFVDMTEEGTPGSGELILTRLFAAQRRLRFVRSTAAALVWFHWGSLLAAVGLVALWNWNHLPGPWQWLAEAGRPAELLWVPFLVALGGFSTRWFFLPSAREAAFKVDQVLESQERFLTAVDWLLTEKPRTPNSTRLLHQAKNLVSDSVKFEKELKKLEAPRKRHHAHLLTFLLPLLLLLKLPTHRVIAPSSAIWLGDAQVDQLTEELSRKLEETEMSDSGHESLKKLLQKLASESTPATSLPDSEKRQLQKLIDQLQQQAQVSQKSRELSQTLAQRARRGLALSEHDQKALRALRHSLQQSEQKKKLDTAVSKWEQENFLPAAQALEELQKQTGEQAQRLFESSQSAADRSGLTQAPTQNREDPSGEAAQFNEEQGDQFTEDGFVKNSTTGNGQGEKDGSTADGKDRLDAGVGTTLKEEPKESDLKAAQSLRRGDEQSEWTEEYQNLHPPERTFFQKSQTKIEGQLGDTGPRIRSPRQGRGVITEGSALSGDGGLLEYRAEAENAILREQVPADYRDNVRTYFESL